MPIYLRNGDGQLFFAREIIGTLRLHCNQFFLQKHLEFNNSAVPLNKLWSAYNELLRKHRTSYFYHSSFGVLQLGNFAFELVYFL